MKWKLGEKKDLLPPPNPTGFRASLGRILGRKAATTSAVVGETSNHESLISSNVPVSDAHHSLDVKSPSVKVPKKASEPAESKPESFMNKNFKSELPAIEKTGGGEDPSRVAPQLRVEGSKRAGKGTQATNVGSQPLDKASKSTSREPVSENSARGSHESHSNNTIVDETIPRESLTVEDAMDKGLGPKTQDSVSDTPETNAHMKNIARGPEHMTEKEVSGEPSTQASTLCPTNFSSDRGYWSDVSDMSSETSLEGEEPMSEKAKGKLPLPKSEAPTMGQTLEDRTYGGLWEYKLYIRFDPQPSIVRSNTRQAWRCFLTFDIGDLKYLMTHGFTWGTGDIVPEQCTWGTTFYKPTASRAPYKLRRDFAILDGAGKRPLSDCRFAGKAHFFTDDFEVLATLSLGFLSWVNITNAVVVNSNGGLVFAYSKFEPERNINCVLDCIPPGSYKAGWFWPEEQDEYMADWRQRMVLADMPMAESSKRKHKS